MRSLYDPTKGKKPYATLNLVAGGCIHVRPSLIEEVVAGKGYSTIKYGHSVIRVKESADRIRKLAETAKKMELEAGRLIK